MPTADPRIPADLAARVDAWIADDPDPADRAELARLRAAGDAAALAERFAGPLTFGTAGLRGPLRAGPAGMNTAVVRRAAAGLARWLTARRPPGRGPATVVIGYDARRRSEAFALDSARVFAGAGLRALVLPRPTPTPVLAFAVRHLGTQAGAGAGAGAVGEVVAGVMVTASHNPATDNGYKVYLGGPKGDPGRGAQLVSPADTEIEQAIAAVGPARSIPLSDAWERLGEDVITAYLTRAVDAVAAALGEDLAPAAEAGPAGADARAAGDRAGLTVAYTPLHGVGAELVEAAFARAGLPAPVCVASQRAPDPDFPTAPFPNPEEPGALDAVLDLGERIGADLVLANDPDADRCAAAVGRRVLTGDEVGLLLADRLLRTRPGPVATTVVSSDALRALAAEAGVDCIQTLTGFKWIMRAHPDLVFGYEEALGYAVAPEVVRDKDGVTAALALALLARAEKRRGRTLLDALDDLQRRHGVYATGQVSIRVDDLAVITATMNRLRAAGPAAVGSRPVTAVRDLAAGGDGLPPADVLVLSLAGGARVVVRPSGTEPKLKIYLQVVTSAGDDLAAARAQAQTELARLRADVHTLLPERAQSPRPPKPRPTP